MLTLFVIPFFMLIFAPVKTKSPIRGVIPQPSPIDSLKSRCLQHDSKTVHAKDIADYYGKHDCSDLIALRKIITGLKVNLREDPPAKVAPLFL